jgi:hypothetical protein
MRNPNRKLFPGIWQGLLAKATFFCYYQLAQIVCLDGGMADAAVSKTVGLITRVGSTPTPGMEVNKVVPM